jgi:ribosome biogenesis GTPase A
LLQTSGKGEVDGNNEATDAEDIDLDAYAEELGLDLEALSKKKLICKRCHDLRNSGRVDELLRPGWTDEPTLSQEQFRNLLRPISTKPAVIIALIDLFDFGGSVLRELDGIAGENPVILAANKADLMPSSMGKNRIENWVRRELEHMGVQSLANVGGAVRLVSCKTGDGVISMMDKAKELANEIDGDIYVVGAANAGKSTLLNYILGRNAKEEKPFNKSNKRAGNRNQFKGQLMTSPLPGTTLKFIKIDLGDGQNVYDTPGLLVPGTITQLLTPDELKVVCPKK